MNLVFLVNILYQGIFRDNFDGMTRVQDFAVPFLYINGSGFLFHLFFGISSRSRKSIPPLLTFRPLLYLISPRYLIYFFLLPIVTIIISKHIEKKKEEENNGENTFK